MLQLLGRNARLSYGATYKVPEEIWLKVHFTDSEASQAAGREFLKRFLRRTENRDPEVNEKVAPAQIEAIGKWGVQREGSYEYLKTILQPTLVINGDNDVIIYSINSWILQQNIPNAQLINLPGRQPRFAVPGTFGDRPTAYYDLYRSRTERSPNTGIRWKPFRRVPTGRTRTESSEPIGCPRSESSQKIIFRS